MDVSNRWMAASIWAAPMAMSSASASISSRDSFSLVMSAPLHMHTS